MNEPILNLGLADHQPSVGFRLAVVPGDFPRGPTVRRRQFDSAELDRSPEEQQRQTMAFDEP